MLDLNSKTLHGIFVTFKTIVNEFWGFYHGTNMGGACSLKALLRFPKAKKFFSMEKESLSVGILCWESL
jgi:hypothetical protein